MYQSGDGASVFDIRVDAAEASSTHVDVEPSILFPNKEFLFTADFRRSGTDLLLVGHDISAIILGYFKDDRRPNIVTHEGASLTGATVEALAGPDLPSRYAQATDTAATRTPIGRVEKVSGSATVLRNGIPVELHLGDTVAKGDVVQTGMDSSLTIKFNDGTVFGLSSSARMVLNDMVYAADSNSNSALLTLVQGAIGFVAGRIAKTGDLKVDTPVATMAIRGTAVQTEVAAFSGVTRFSLLTEPDGTVGTFVLLDKNDPTRVIATMSDARTATVITPITASDLRIAQVTKTADDIRGEGNLVRDLFQVFSLEPRQRRGSSDFEDAPTVPVNLPQLVDPPDSSQFVVTPILPERIASRDLALPPLTFMPASVRGTAIEDGPPARLDALTNFTAAEDDAAPTIVSLTASLPPGVRYLKDSRSFSLDPSHPAYQHLGEGETATVTVNYSLMIAGTRVPASVSWTVTGRNDAPVATSEIIAPIGEVGRTVLDVRANDRDVDGDPLQVVRWTAPIEGSVSRNASGDLVFDPGDDFRALSAGETATLSFAYTISDTKGGVDTANVTLQVQGTGVFSSPRKTDSMSGVLDFNNQPVSLSIDAPSATTTTTADLSLRIGFGSIPQPQMNILYLIDISGSMSEPFTGTPVGDLNNDGRFNTLLDAEIASLIALTDRISGLGFSPADVTVTVIPFNSSADPAEPADPAGEAVNAATFSLGRAGEAMIADYLRGLNASRHTDFANALRAANGRLQALDQGDEGNFLYFLSDGYGQGSTSAELATLNEVYRAKITAIGIGGNASLSRLDEIDNTGGASRLTAPDQIDISILGTPLSSGTVADLDVFVNGREIVEIGLEDLIRTPEGLGLNASIGGLGRLAGDTNTLSATITFQSGEILTTDLVVAGALPRSTDIIM